MFDLTPVFQTLIVLTCLAGGFTIGRRLQNVKWLGYLLAPTVLLILACGLYGELIPDLFFFSLGGMMLGLQCSDLQPRRDTR